MDQRPTRCVVTLEPQAALGRSAGRPRVLVLPDGRGTMPKLLGDGGMDQAAW